MAAVSTLDVALCSLLLPPGPFSPSTSPAAIVAAVASSSSPSAPSASCGYVFKNNDITWKCRTCQTDDTCVLCQDCFSNSDHEGHEVFFHRTRAGGCCDCGDLEAWKAAGCCPKHRGGTGIGVACAPALPESLSQPARVTAEVVVQYVRRVAVAAELSFKPVSTHARHSGGGSVEARAARPRPPPMQPLEAPPFGVADDEEVAPAELVGDGGAALAEAWAEDLVAEALAGALAEQQRAVVDPPPDAGGDADDVPPRPPDDEAAVAAAAALQVGREVAVPLAEVLAAVAAAAATADGAGTEDEDVLRLAVAAAEPDEMAADVLDAMAAEANDELDDELRFHVRQRAEMHAAAEAAAAAAAETDQPAAHPLLPPAMANGGGVGGGGPAIPVPRSVVGGGGSSSAASNAGGGGSSRSKAPRAGGEWVVRLHNDDVHTVDFVLTTLTRLALGRDLADALVRRIEQDGLADIHRGNAPSSRAVFEALRTAGLMTSMVPLEHMRTEATAHNAVSWLCAQVDQIKPLIPVVAAALLSGSPHTTAAPFDASIGIDEAGSRGSAASSVPRMIYNVCAAGLSPAELKLVALAEEAAVPEGSIFAVEESAIKPPPPPRGEALRSLMRVDAMLPRRLAGKLHTVYLSCLPDAVFKRAFAEAFCDLYLSLAVQYGGGMGSREDCLFGFSVQLFTTPSIVHALLPRGLLTRVLLALDYMLHASSICDAAANMDVADERVSEMARSWTPGSTSTLPTLDCEASILIYRRYEFVVRDLEYILTIDGVAQQFVATPNLMWRWLKVLTRFQCADMQLRFISAHIEHDSRSWIQAFNLHLTLSSIFTAVLKPLTDLVAAPGACNASGDDRALEAVPLAASMGSIMVRALARWIGQGHVQLVELPLPPRGFGFITGGEASFRVSTAGFIDGELSRGCSLHIPLHRFFAAMIREASAIGSSPDACGQVLDALCSSHAEVDGEEAAKSLNGLTLIDTTRSLGARFWRRVVEHPMRISAFAAQIAAGMWRRNGVAMINQLVNYGGAPLCLRLRDADVLLMQASIAQLVRCDDDTALWGVGSAEWGGHAVETRDGFLLALAHKFGLYRWLLLACGATDEAFERAGALKSERAADDNQRLGMSEEFLRLLIVLVTELPRPTGTDSFVAQLRREVVHRLIAQPSTRSELSECADLTMHPRHARKEVETVLREVAVRKSAPMGITSPIPTSRAPKFELKRECVNEYDPEFFHLTDSMHKSAAERARALTALLPSTAPASTSGSPMAASASHDAVTPLQLVAPPPPAHPSFLIVRRLLFAPPLLALVRSSLARAVLSATTKHTDQPDAPSPTADCGLAASAALLTLAKKRREAQQTWPFTSGVAAGAIGVVAQAPAASSSRSTEELAKGIVSAAVSAAANRDGSRQAPGEAAYAAWTCSVNEAVDAAKSESSERLVARSLHLLTLMMHCAEDDETDACVLTGDERTGFFRMLCSDHPTESAAPNSTTRGVGTSSVVKLVRLLSLKKWEMQRACRWLVLTMRKDQLCAARLQEIEEEERAAAETAMAKSRLSTPGSTASNGDSQERESRLERKRRAQQRALAQVARQSERFVESLAGADADAMASDDSGTRINDGEGNSDDVAVEPETAPLCIICHTEDLHPIGFVCCAQPSAVLCDAPPPIIGRDSDSGDGGASLNHQHVHFCGHAVHTECLSQYLRAVRQRAASGEHYEGRSAIHVAGGEFLCPMCKRVSNALVPHLSPSPAELRLAEATLQLGPPTALDLLALAKEEYTWSARCTRYRESLAAEWHVALGNATPSSDRSVLDDLDGSYDAIAVAHGPAVADRLVCVITQSLMIDPVSTADGATYERAAIELWLQDHSTSPATGETLLNLTLTPQPTLASEAQNLRAHTHAALAAPPAEALDDLWWLRQIVLHGYSMHGRDAKERSATLPRLPWRKAAGISSIAGEEEHGDKSTVDALSSWLDAPSSCEAAAVNTEGPLPATVSPWEAAWGWQVRPTPARHVAVANFAKDLRLARSPSWASAATSGSVPDPPLDSRCAWVASELLSTLAYTLSARVAFVRHDTRRDVDDPTVGSTFGDRWRQLEAELQQSRPLRSLVHAARLSLCGVVMRPLLATGHHQQAVLEPGDGAQSTASKSGEHSDKTHEGSGRVLPWKVPLLHSDAFDVLLAAAFTSAHSTAELSIVVQVCAIAAIAREAVLFILDPPVEAIIAQDQGSPEGVPADDELDGARLMYSLLAPLLDAEVMNASVCAPCEGDTSTGSPVVAPSLIYTQLLVERARMALDGYVRRALALTVLISGQGVPSGATLPHRPIAGGDEGPAHAAPIDVALAAVGLPTLRQVLQRDAHATRLRVWVRAALPWPGA